jgi:hypothetical protein
MLRPNLFFVCFFFALGMPVRNTSYLLKTCWAIAKEQPLARSLTLVQQHDLLDQYTSHRLGSTAGDPKKKFDSSRLCGYPISVIMNLNLRLLLNALLLPGAAVEV